MSQPVPLLEMKHMLQAHLKRNQLLQHATLRTQVSSFFGGKLYTYTNGTASNIEYLHVHSDQSWLGSYILTNVLFWMLNLFLMNVSYQFTQKVHTWVWVSVIFQKLQWNSWSLLLNVNSADPKQTHRSVSCSCSKMTTLLIWIFSWFMGNTYQMVLCVYWKHQNHSNTYINRFKSTLIIWMFPLVGIEISDYSYNDCNML